MTYYASPRWSGEVPDCSVPMTFDQHSNCAFGCLYCFSAFQRGIGTAKTDYLAKTVNTVDVRRVRRIFTDPAFSEFGPFVQARRVLQWGGLSDPFCGFERKMGTALELLRLFKELDYPITFSTKGTWWLDDERYTDLFRGQANWNVKVSIITLDAEKARAIEVGVPPPEKRLRAIEKIVALGCTATLRLRPFMLGITDPHHVELIRRAASAGATAVSTEFFCLEQRSMLLREHMGTISRLAGFDYFGFYKRYSVSNGYMRLNRNVKRPFVDEMERACTEAGIRLHVSDAHFKERSSTGSCCGLPAEANYSRGQFTEALVLCRANGRVSWPEIEGGLAWAADIEAGGADGCQIAAGCSAKRAQFARMSLYDVLRWLWNNPTAGQSPYTMFEGVMRPVAKDERGDLVYEYDESRA